MVRFTKDPDVLRPLAVFQDGTAPTPVPGARLVEFPFLPWEKGIGMRVSKGCRLIQ